MSEAALQAMYVVEKRLALGRLLIVCTGLVYPLWMSPAGTIPWLANTLLALAIVYAAWILWFEPYRRFALMTTNTFTVVEALFTLPWIYATGGFESPFFIAIYMSLIVVAFRNPLRDALWIAAVYAVCYVLLLLAMGEAMHSFGDLAVRLAYLFLAVIVGFNVSQGVIAQRIAMATIQEQERAAAQIRQSQALLSEAQAIAHMGSWELDARTDGVTVSPELRRIHGVDEGATFTADELFVTRISPEDRALVSEAIAAARQQGAPFSIEYRLARADGTQRWVHARGRPQGERIVGTTHDITERKELENRLKGLAYQDPLTGLANRRALYERLESALALARRKDWGVALLYMDLDRFKPVNDRLGHHAGDELLIAISESLSQELRGSDNVARIGGDEFAVVLNEVSQEGAEQVASRLASIVATPKRIRGEEVEVGVSIGLAVFPTDGTTADELLRCADSAMYRNKMGRARA
jgi:diguanylate cyclase (GGDEF)-like protein/PAS domain S-box-containing protein